MIIMQISRFLILCCFFLLPSFAPLSAQESDRTPFLQVADTFNSPRFWTSFGLGAAAYTTAMVGLSQIWYAEYPQSRFHLFNDWGEWESMDKLGHAYTTYLETSYGFHILNWTGLKRSKSLWVSVGMAMLFQTSLETLDGFSEKWGFSIPDMAFNSLGAGMFLTQELVWHEQRILFKISSSGGHYPDTPVLSEDGSTYSSLAQRAEELYGGALAARLIKDYNAQTVWLSGNIHSFLPDQSKFPRWLNVAVGYGANNMYGGFDNTWEQDGQTYVLDPEVYPRYQQFYLSLDLDFSKIPTRNRFLRTIFKGLNVLKLPAPTLEFNTIGQTKFHPLLF